MSVSVSDIIKRMKELRSKPMKSVTKNRRQLGEAYSTRVKPVNQVVPKTSGPIAKVPASCEKYSAKGFGAATMTVPQLTEFIKKKAPKPVFEQFSRLQKKSRPELCKLLAQFEEGYRLLYPENKPRTPEPNLPAANNVEGMLNLAERLQQQNTKKIAKKVAERYNAAGFTVPVSPTSPASLVNSSPGTPNYVNYMNNNAPSEEARMRERNAYLRKLYEKRVVRDPLEGKLSAANLKRFRVQPIKRKKLTPPPIKYDKSITNLSLMKLSNGNMRAPTSVTRGLTVTTSPQLTKAQLRNLRNQAVRTRGALSKLLANLRSVPVKNRSAINRMRIRFLARRLADPAFENKFVNKEKYRATILQRVGLASPPKSQSPPGRPFSMSSTRLLSNNQTKLLTKMKRKPTANKSSNRMNNLKEKIVASMNAARKRQANYRNILNFKIDGKHCMSYKKSQLVKVARLLTKGKIENLNSFTKEELCIIIKENRSKK